MMIKFYELSQPWFKVRKSASILATTLAIAFFSLLSLSTFAQGNTITGKVIDKTGEGLPGVTVLVKGTTNGVATDFDGNYSIANVPKAATLVYSFVGSETQEVAVNNQSVINVTLADDNTTLEEVVVIGYGTQKVKDATGSVATIGSKDFNKGLINNPEQLLQGRVSGVQLTPTSGEPGAGININIRGTTSIRGNNGPLYVVDGIPLDNSDSSPNGSSDAGTGTVASRNPLNFLNPADIENISVLKDASSAAIYGARGANGVVLITTKQGKSGEGTFNFSANGSISSAANRYDLLNASEIVSEFNKAGLDTTDPLINGGADSDWQDSILRNAFSQNYNMSFGGGSDNTNYYFSLGYQDQQGIIKQTSQEKLTARINASHKLFDDRVKIGVNLTTTKTTDVQGATGGDVGFEGNLISTSIIRNPTLPMYNADGSFYTTGSPTFRSPVALLDQFRINTPSFRTLTNVYGSWKIIDNLTYKLSAGLDNVSSTQNVSVDPGAMGFETSIVNNQGLAGIGNLLRNNTTIEHTLNYTKDLNKSNLDMLLGFAYYKFENTGNNIVARYFVAPEGFPIINNIGFVDNSGTQKAYDGGSYKNQSEMQSFFGRATYNYDEKYFLTGTLRADGSSKFGKNNKYGLFPSVAAGWTISNEPFMQDNNVFSNLKLRGSWGIVGNSEGFPINQTLTTYIPNKNSGGISKENVANPDLKWEETTSYNVGLDFGFLNGRLSSTIDYFYKGTDNLLFPLPAAQPDVATTRWSNLPANIVNKGVEVAVYYDVLTGKKLTWDVAANATFLTNEVESLSISTARTGDVFGQGLSGAFVQPIRVGYPLYSFFVKEFLGYDESGNTMLGDEKNFGSPFPAVTWGLNNSFSYGQWFASMFINGQNGGKIFNNTALAIFGNPAINQGNNSDKAWLDADQSFSDGLTPSSKYVESSDFVRLSNLNIGYNFDFANNKSIKGLGITLSGQNLLLITKYSGLDPEVLNIAADKDGIPSKGIDYLPYPKARTFTLGLNARF